MLQCYTVHIAEPYNISICITARIPEMYMYITFNTAHIAETYTVKPALTVTSVKRSPAHNDHCLALPTFFTI